MDSLERSGSETALGLESAMKEELSLEIEPPFKESVATAEDWRNALNKVVPAVVVLRTTACRAFDTEAAGASYATGFVVDKSRGIILTNRHVVKPGPVVAEAMFVNREEIPVYPVYRDPVHDFGFFRYDPGAIQFLNYEEIPLVPEAACVGLEIRVVGNDSGEKVSILAGTLARLDRDAPHYKKDGYNDFNTFYMQAASGTKGGSSGSPVIDWQGQAVALNAGSKSSSASAFFLPLERVVRALHFLQNGWDSNGGKWKAVAISRGTLQVTFLHKGFDETRRLGLQSETEQMVRQASPASETGMLVVDSVVPGGPAHKHLQPGDILVRVNGEVITQFLKLETILDDGVSQKIDILIERGGTSVNLILMVQDLHSVTPDFFLEVSGAVIHPLSYQQASSFSFLNNVKVRQEIFDSIVVWYMLQNPGTYMLSRAGVPRHAIIKKFAGEEISQLDDLILALSKLSRGARVPLEYTSYMDRHRSKSVLVTVDRHEWYASPQIYTRNDSTGLWTARAALPPGSLLLSSNVLCDGNATKCDVAKDTSKAGPLEPMLEEMNKDGTDSFTIMQTNDEHLTEEIHYLEESHVESKRRRLEEDSSVDGVFISERAITEPAEERLGRTLENPGYADERAVATANASVAERVIEPTLVMFEVWVVGNGRRSSLTAQDAKQDGSLKRESTIGSQMMIIIIISDGVGVGVGVVVPYFFNKSSLFLVVKEPTLRRGDSVYLVGLSRSLQATSRKSTVTNPCAALNIGSADCPRYRATNMEVIELDTDFGSTFSGVLTDEHGMVQAIWGSFSTQVKYGCSTSEDHQFVRGLPIYAISEVLDKIINGAKGPPLLINGVKRPMPLLRILEAELYPTLLSKARNFGLGDNWIQALVKKDPIRRQVLRVKGCLAGSKAELVLEQGDMILAIDKEPITCFRDIEKACQEIDKSDSNNGELNMTILRQLSNDDLEYSSNLGKEIEISVGTDIRDGNGTTRLVNWCGCIIQDPHSAVRALGFLPEEGHGVYVARVRILTNLGTYTSVLALVPSSPCDIWRLWCHGSPVHRYGLYALQWIIEVNGKLTPDLESFVEVAKGLEHEEFVRVRTVHLNGKPRVLTLKQDLHYWPTWELKFDPDTATWRRRIIKALDESIV
ncbi:hypothetical protein Syun_022164 [Stephania yunnanensis]|uniref:PDZ domain-containing protein n=1 Tax=Stephania yunnanensis TaxID=152371 RepID=A0AAP0IIX2_9MAGN